MVTSNDTVLAGGECDIAFADEYMRAIKPSLPDDLKDKAIVNSVAVSADGRTALATYVSGSKTAQALLTHVNGVWTLAQPVAAPTDGGKKITSTVVSSATLHALQSRVKFDVATPVLRVGR